MKNQKSHQQVRILTATDTSQEGRDRRGGSVKRKSGGKENRKQKASDKRTKKKRAKKVVHEKPSPYDGRNIAMGGRMKKE